MGVFDCQLCGGTGLHYGAACPECGHKVIPLRAIDMMARFLAEHNHQWTDLEKDLYERAVKVLEES